MSTDEGDAMTNRYQPNETACPVPLELLALLMRSSEARIVELVEAQPEVQRARLAAFCFQRSHMRGLGLAIATRCSEDALWKTAGFIGELLFEQSRSQTPFDAEPVSPHKRKVTLARAA